MMSDVRITAKKTVKKAPKKVVERMEWVVCGRFIGRASGWDQIDTFALQLYDFEPAPGYAGPVAKDVSISFESGRIESYDDEGSVSTCVDLVDAISGCERRDL